MLMKCIKNKWGVLAAVAVAGMLPMNVAAQNAPTNDSGKGVAELTTETVQEFDFSPKGLKAFKADPENEMYDSAYDALGGGCSFYCGCEIGELKASSELKPQGKFTYEAKNMHDLNYASAWVEGAPGDGIGEWVEYTLPANNPRITTLNIANGYVRTKKAWTENSRVKVLDVEVNGVPHAKVHLKDYYGLQSVDIPTIGYEDRENFEGKEPIRIRFIIREVYPGTKYQDTAISDIYFGGIDVH